VIEKNDFLEYECVLLLIEESNPSTFVDNDIAGDTCPSGGDPI
jgi:hypothetical protein